MSRRREWSGRCSSWVVLLGGAKGLTSSFTRSSGDLYPYTKKAAVGMRQTAKPTVKGERRPRAAMAGQREARRDGSAGATTAQISTHGATVTMRHTAEMKVTRAEQRASQSCQPARTQRGSIRNVG